MVEQKNYFGLNVIIQNRIGISRKFSQSIAKITRNKNNSEHYYDYYHFTN